MVLDFNHRPSFQEKVNNLIDRALIAANRHQTPRAYLGASRLGISCARALQYEYTQTPKDQDFPGKTLRIFAIGHKLEEMAIGWLRDAGLHLFTQKQDGGQFGFSTAGGRIAGHVDGIITGAPESLGLSFPMLWECKTMNARNWKLTCQHGVRKSKPVYAAQIALYQAYMEATIPGISQNPCLFTSINKDTSELYHELVPFDAAVAQEASDRGVRILQATDSGEWLPRVTSNPECFTCRFCDYRERCWEEADATHG